MFLVLVGIRAQAGPLVTTDSPIGFFTNIASRLLSAQVGLDLNHIQVYPTNQYTPAVHRILQVTANLYDAATNRPFAADYPYLPSVFRPLFRCDTNGAVFIAGYREVVDDAVASFAGSGPTNVVLGFNNSAVPPYGTPFALEETNEPLVLGIPLVIGAKKGLPNFNEFGMQTSVLVTRSLQFRRQEGLNTGPIVETNQMYLVYITNACGVEVWNSYHASYPRNLELRLDTVMVASVTNELGTLLLSNAMPLRPVAALVPTNTWPGFTPIGSASRGSFKALLNSGLFLTNSMYSESLQSFQSPGGFERGNGFPVPHWYLSLRPMLRFALVDTSVSPSRVIDYVSLDSPQAPSDVAAFLTSGGQCSLYYAPDGNAGSMWCTNRLTPSVFAPTYGVMNQIGVGVADITSYQWLYPAHQAEVDFFRTQFGLGPIFYPPGTFSFTNIFYAPFNPTRAISFYVSWQANDPLVHYALPDLTDAFSSRPLYELDSTGFSSLTQIGGLDWFTGQAIGTPNPLNFHYRPWGGSPLNGVETSPSTNWKLELKDPLVRWSDDWNFPTNQLSDLSWLGRVHRGTPWQTLYLKSSAIDLPTWTVWTGDTQLTALGGSGAQFVYDAALTLPTNDWRLASLLVSLLSTNDPRLLMSVNEPSAPVWESALDGFAALTNTASDAQLKILQLRALASFDTVLVQSNSPQASFLAVGTSAARANQLGQRFSQAGDILATPELSVASPFLNQGSTIAPFPGPARYTVQQTYGLSDAAYEAIPAQLLPRLRPDSVASIIPGPGPLQVKFTGADGYAYAVQVSTNLLDWTGVGTNYPVNGSFIFQESLPPGAGCRFYRSSLLP